MYVELQLCLSKLALAPVPTTKGMLLVFEICAVPTLEDLAQTLEILQMLACHSAQRLGDHTS